MQLRQASPVEVLAAAARHHTWADTLGAVIIGLALIPILFVIVMLCVRWRRARGAHNRWQVYESVFGERGAKRISIGYGVYFVICVVLFVLTRVAGG